MKPILVVLGTRPEAIKLWPVIEALRARNLHVELATGNQQKDLLRPICEELGLRFDHDEFRSPEHATRSLTERFADYISWFDTLLRKTAYSLVVVQGDTTTALAGALAAFYAQVPVAHVEAGLRTYDLTSPFPEEGNRQMIARVAALHFCPTNDARTNIVDELASPLDEDGAVYAVGNTVVDAMKRITRERKTFAPKEDILVTFHRRESWAEARQVARAIAGLTNEHTVTWIRHANTSLRNQIEDAAYAWHFEHPGDAGIYFVDPIGYRDFLQRVQGAKLVITDSGGVIEECTTLGTPCLILRDVTERSEALEHGHHIVPLSDLSSLKTMVPMMIRNGAKPSDCFGDGRTAERIVGHIEDFLRLQADRASCS